MDVNEIIENSKQFGSEEFTQSLTDGFKSLQTSNQEMNGKIEGLTSDLSKSITKRDSLKSMVKTKFGLEEVNDETLDGAISSLGSRGTEELRETLTRNETLYKTNLEAESNKTAQAYLDLSIYKSGALEAIDSPVARDLILAQLRSGAVIEGSDIVYYENDNLKMSEGKPLTVEGRLQALKADAAYEFIFQKQPKSGGGKDPQGSGGEGRGSRTDLSKLTHGEKAKLMKELGVDGYQKLVAEQINKNRQGK